MLLRSMDGGSPQFTKVAAFRAQDGRMGELARQYRDTLIEEEARRVYEAWDRVNSGVYAVAQGRLYQGRLGVTVAEVDGAEKELLGRWPAFEQEWHAMEAVAGKP